jgi:hypothetical protein
MDYATTIEHERRAVSLLRKKLEEREARLKLLLSLASAPDAFDKALEEELAPKITFRPRADLTITVADPQKPSGTVAISAGDRAAKVLEFIGEDEKSMEELTDFMMKAGIYEPGEESKARRFMFTLKGNNAVYTPSRGIYRKKQQELSLTKP